MFQKRLRRLTEKWNSIIWIFVFLAWWKNADAKMPKCQVRNAIMPKHYISLPFAFGCWTFWWCFVARHSAFWHYAMTFNHSEFCHLTFIELKFCHLTFFYLSFYYLTCCHLTFYYFNILSFDILTFDVQSFDIFI
jgi:hypothetical protein